MPLEGPRLDSPIIIIGNGRSGSTLLNEIINAHPDIIMFGELNFAVPRLWQALAELNHTTFNDDLREHLASTPGLEDRLARWPHCIDDVVYEIQTAEELRKAGILRDTLAASLRLAVRRGRYWGFKEIWNGSAGLHDWRIYDTVFPNAWWVHIVRDPLQFVRSAAWHEGNSINEAGAVNRLKSWLNVFTYNRKPAPTGRYVEIKYERLVDNPRAELADLFERLNLVWDNGCADVLSRQFGYRSDREPMIEGLMSLTSEVPGLSAAMAELGYNGDDVPAPSVIGGHDCTPDLGLNENGRWRLAGPIWREYGHALRYEFFRSELAPKLREIADDVRFWERSPLRLFEDDRPLGPAHSLHLRVREGGSGRYSHWQNGLLFSTSDNTDPNRNGRIYSIALKAD